MLKLKLNPSNPRTIGKKEFERLKKSIKEFPKMLELRPIVYDKDNMILGGNMRYRVLEQLIDEGFEVKDEYFKKAEDLTEKEKRVFVIKDNLSDGRWDDDVLANEWDDLPLEEWGIDIKGFDKEEKIEPEIDFTEELMEEHNYVVLYFENEIDWLQLQSVYPLDTVKSLDSRKGFEKKGIGRVIKGVDFLNRILK